METIQDEAPTAIWDLHTPKKIKLILLNTDTMDQESVELLKGFNQKKLSFGHWQISGFDTGETIYSAVSSAPVFLFNIGVATHVYSGSIVIECPRVGKSHIKNLKKMRFFNRYEFVSQKGECEMIVGNDYENIVNNVKNNPETKDLKLNLGF